MWFEEDGYIVTVSWSIISQFGCLPPYPYIAKRWDSPWWICCCYGGRWSSSRWFDYGTDCRYNLNLSTTGSILTFFRDTSSLSGTWIHLEEVDLVTLCCGRHQLNDVVLVAQQLHLCCSSPLQNVATAQHKQTLWLQGVKQQNNSLLPMYPQSSQESSMFGVDILVLLLFVRAKFQLENILSIQTTKRTDPCATHSGRQLPPVRHYCRVVGARPLCPVP